MKPSLAFGSFPGVALDQVLVGDVPSRLQKHTCSLYQFFEKYTRPYTNFSKKYIRPYIFHLKIANR